LSGSIESYLSASGLCVDLALAKSGGPVCGFEGNEDAGGCEEKVDAFDGLPKTDVACCKGAAVAKTEVG